MGRLGRLVLCLTAAAGLAVLLCRAVLTEEAKGPTPIPLFNGKDLDGLYPFVAGHKKGEDPDGVFRVEDGMIRIAGKPNGYLMTEKQYDDFRVRIEYKWATTEEGPRRNSGLLVRCQEPDGIWPTSFECQLMHTNEGDFWLCGNTTLTVDGKEQSGGRVRKKASGTKPLGEWNVVEAICDGGTITNIVNGVEVNKGTNASLRRGKILVQSEGAPLLVRKWELIPLRSAREGT